MKEEQRSYDGEKPKPQDWADLYESDPKFKNEFNQKFSDGMITEADDFAPDVLDDTYLNMELTLPKDGESAQFAKVTKILRDANGLQIVVSHDNPMLYTRIYGFIYHNEHKAFWTYNTITKN